MLKRKSLRGRDVDLDPADLRPPHAGHGEGSAAGGQSSPGSPADIPRGVGNPAPFPPARPGELSESQRWVRWHRFWRRQMLGDRAFRSKNT